ncbi:MAG TPA: spermidine synthase [Thermoanaerobaculia bacterium]|nr:spermidine synthase [Thermoanaerobaculia bacterium]
MTRPWEVLDAVETEEGRLELRRRGEGDFVITVGGRVLMNSAWHRSEIAVAQLACRRIADRPRPRVLIGGLGMGFTLRAALDELPRGSRVVVAEIEPAVVRWCRGPLAGLTGRAVDDPRVEIALADVSRLIAEATQRFDAIVLDLYEGPRTATQAREDPFWGPAALRRTREALAPGGVFSVWSEDPDAAFEKRLITAGFRVERRRPESGGPRHAVYLALTPR